MPKLDEINLIAWGLSLAGGICAALAGYCEVKTSGYGGALAAAALYLNGAAGVWGYFLKPASSSNG